MRKQKAPKPSRFQRFCKFGDFCCWLLLLVLFGTACGYKLGTGNFLPEPTAAITAPVKAAANCTTINEMLVRMVQVESAGNPKAVSPKGARGLTQVMPHTAKDPGFGVKPMRNHSQAEQLRFGNEYLNAMQAYYGGNKVLAAAAYNAGYSTVDRALELAKGDVHKAIKLLPAETQAYVVKVALYTPPVTLAMNDGLFDKFDRMQWGKK